MRGAAEAYLTTNLDIIARHLNVAPMGGQAATAPLPLERARGQNSLFPHEALGAGPVNENAGQHGAAPAAVNAHQSHVMPIDTEMTDANVEATHNSPEGPKESFATPMSVVIAESAVATQESTNAATMSSLPHASSDMSVVTAAPVPAAVDQVANGQAANGQVANGQAATATPHAVDQVANGQAATAIPPVVNHAANGQTAAAVQNIPAQAGNGHQGNGHQGNGHQGNGPQGAQPQGAAAPGTNGQPPAHPDRSGMQLSAANAQAMLPPSACVFVAKSVSPPFIGSHVSTH